MGEIEIGAGVRGGKEQRESTFCKTIFTHGSDSEKL